MGEDSSTVIPRLVVLPGYFYLGRCTQVWFLATFVSAERDFVLWRCYIAQLISVWCIFLTDVYKVYYLNPPQHLLSQSGVLAEVHKG